jgi:hypothetical protein
MRPPTHSSLFVASPVQPVGEYSFQTISKEGVNLGVFVFKEGTFVNHGDGGYINWAFRGEFKRDGDTVDFSAPEPFAAEVAAAEVAVDAMPADPAAAAAGDVAGAQPEAAPGHVDGLPGAIGGGDDLYVAQVDETGHIGVQSDAINYGTLGGCGDMAPCTFDPGFDNFGGMAADGGYSAYTQQNGMYAA